MISRETDINILLEQYPECAEFLYPHYKKAEI
jgi:hypothetical protein